MEVSMDNQDINDLLNDGIVPDEPKSQENVGKRKENKKSKK